MVPDATAIKFKCPKGLIYVLQFEGDKEYLVRGDTKILVTTDSVQDFTHVLRATWVVDHWEESIVSQTACSEGGFGWAIDRAVEGNKVHRHGKEEFMVYMSPLSLPAYSTQGTDRKVNDRTAKYIGKDTPLESLGYFALVTADKKWQPGWIPSQEDMLATNWEVVE